MTHEFDQAELNRRRSRARKTAVWLVLLALGIYAAFILSGVLGRAS